MKNNKKILLSVLGIFILLIAVLGITYSFFSYLSTGSENTVQVGQIEFTASHKTMQLTNVFPTTLEEAEDVATVSVQGYTTYEHGIDFTIKAVDVTPQNTNIIPTVVVERETIEGITYTDGGSQTTTYDKNNRLTSDTVLCTGHVEGDTRVGSTEELVKLLTISAYYDKVEYHISDNTKEELIQYGMLPEGYAGKVISTKDWNALSKDSEGNDVIAYSFKIEVTAVEGRVVSQDSLEYALVNSLNLTEADVDGTRYVYGETEDNYLWYSGKMWRIVALNSDGTVKLVTEKTITSLSFDTSSANADYSTSQMRSWLNTEFLPTINANLIVKSNWDYTTYNSFPIEKDTENAISVSDKVGLLSVYDYMMAGGTNDSSTSKTYLNNGNFWWTTSPRSSTKVWTISNNGYAINYLTPTSTYGVRPSVNLKANITITAEGNGTIETPYILEGDTEKGQANELLSSRISGEYIKFNDVLYRIVGMENGLTKITMADYSVNKNNLKYSIAFGASTDEITFSTTYGIGKYLDDWYNATSESDTNGTYTGLYLSEKAKAMIATPTDGVRWYAGPDSGGTGYDYIKAQEGTAIAATIGLGRYGEVFSTQLVNENGTSTYIWLMTKYSDTSVWTVGSTGDAVSSGPSTPAFGVRPSMYLKADVKIVSGSGMPRDPYVITQ